MKKKGIYYLYFVILCCIGFTLSGCSEEESLIPNKEEYKSIRLNVGIEESDIVTRAISDGAKENVNWDDYRMRYILEVWRSDLGAVYVACRDVKTSDEFSSSVSFDVKLIRGVKYDFLFWADVVSKDSNEDLYYETYNTTDGHGLKSIYRRPYDLSDNDACDAYTAATRQRSISEIDTMNIQLSRPLAKLITEITDLNGADYAVVSYNKVPLTYNVYMRDTIAGVDYVEDYRTIPVDNKILTWDYIFTPRGEEIKIEYTVTGFANNKPIWGALFSDIPLMANKLTKVSISGNSSAVKPVYNIGDCYDDGTNKGIVYYVDKVAIGQRIDIFSLKQHPEGTYSNAITNCMNEGDGWHLPTLEEITTLSNELRKHYEITFQKWITDNNGDQLKYFGKGNYSVYAHWSSTSVETNNNNAYLKWLPNEEAIFETDAKTASHFYRAVKTGIINR